MMHCLILEDEASAIEILQGYINKTPFINCLGTYESGLDIPPEQLQQADLLFLDIQLPELNGISFLKTLSAPPKVIVTSAFPGYAIEAFEEAVIDYLVKPFSFERFFKAVTRVRQLILPHQKDKNSQLFLYADKTIYKTLAEDILFLKAEVDYVKVVTINRQILILDSLQNWEDKLSGHQFIRTHRSYIINLNKIEKISGNQIYIEKDIIPISRKYKENFNQTLKRMNHFEWFIRVPSWDKYQICLFIAGIGWRSAKSTQENFNYENGETGLLQIIDQGGIIGQF